MRSPFTTRISSRGQVVIPGPVRKALSAESVGCEDVFADPPARAGRSRALAPVSRLTICGQVGCSPASERVPASRRIQVPPTDTVGVPVPVPAEISRGAMRWPTEVAGENS